MRNIGRKGIRYLRHVSRIGFFLLIIIVGGWIFYQGTTCTLLMPLQELWFACPLGQVQQLLAYRMLLLILIIPAVIFIIMTIVLGRAFCSWVCPMGAIIDLVDGGLAKLKFTPVFGRERFKVGVQGERRIESIKKGLNVTTPALVAYVAFSQKQATFCYHVCPIGGICRGAGAPLEQMAIIPIVASLSFGEKRFFCKYLCPVGAVLTGISALNPFIKPKVNEEKCRVKGCPEDCEDYRYDYCAICRLTECGSSDRTCIEACPEDIDLLNASASFLRCTKCLNCYVDCKQAIRIGLVSKPDILRPFSRLYYHIRRRAPS